MMKFLLGVRKLRLLFNLPKAEACRFRIFKLI